MKIKMIVSDVDNTLMKNFNSLTKEVIEAVKYCNNKNIKFAIASGRGTFNIKDIARRIEDEGGIVDYIIGYNGAEVYDNINYKFIHQDFLSKEEVQEILEVIDGEDLYFYLHEDDKYYTNIEKENTLASERIKRGYKVLDFERIISSPKVFLFVNEEKSDSIYKRIQEKIGKRYNVVKSAPDVIDINKKGVSKKSGYLSLLGYAELNNSDCLCFGDSQNDYELLEYAVNSVSVNNASQEIKELCKYQTMCCEENGVPKFIMENI